MAEPFSTVCAALPFGWSVVYALKVEGIPLYMMERALLASNPTGYTQHACLVIDDSAKVGALVDLRRGVAKSYDLTVNIQRDSTTQAYFAKPSNITALTADLDYDEEGAGSSMTVEDSSGFSASGTVYIGREAIDYASKADSTHFNVLSRGEPNSDWKAFDHTAGSGVATWVTDTPLYWRGREVELQAIPVDPYGVASTTVASVLWRGFVQTKPIGHSDGWTLQCRSYERRLGEKIGVEYSGTGQWSFGGDPLLSVIAETAIDFEFDLNTSIGTDVKLTLKPFEILGSG